MAPSTDGRPASRFQLPASRWVGERSVQRRSVAVRRRGADGSANAGMSSVNADENSAHRKPQGSYARSFRVGLVGPKLRAKAVSDGQLVSIPAPLAERFKAQGRPRKVGGADPLDMVRPHPVGVWWEANPPSGQAEGLGRAETSVNASPLSLCWLEKSRC